MPQVEEDSKDMDIDDFNETKQQRKVKLEVDDVTIHPLVLLSVADHYHRVARGTRKRVVGVLLGQVYKGKVDATNSFAVPFEEDSRNPAVFYLDHNFLEQMLIMFRKVNATERIVGFYSTGPQIRPNDLRIHDIVERFTGNYQAKSKAVKLFKYPTVFCIIDVRPDRPDLPITSYRVTEELSTGQSVKRTFAHVPSHMGAMEAEEIGVEHLLRDIHDPTVSKVASQIQAKLSGLSTLHEKLMECKEYLESCVRGEIKVNPDIVANLQTIFSLLPNLNSEDLIRSMMIKTNDMHMSIYLASLIRSVIALHSLVNNKIRYGADGTKDEEQGTEEKKEDDKDAAKSVDNDKSKDKESK